MSVGFFDERRGSYLGPKGLPTNAHHGPPRATEALPWQSRQVVTPVGR
jgi:hypothetical protein